MFGKIHEKVSYPGSKHELIESTLSGHFVPFRSPNLEALENKKEAFDFGEKIWSGILASLQPELFICIEKETAKRLRKIIATTYDLSIGKPHQLQTGWGNTTADIVEFGNSSESKLLRLPHLSRFTLFTSGKCKEKTDYIFTQFCNKT